MSKADQKAREAIERTENTSHPSASPPAGPHARKSLTDKSKTPGAGTLPERHEDDVNPGSG